MAIEIKTEKVWNGGAPCRRIIKIKAFAKDQLPKKYIDVKKQPCCFLKEEKLWYVKKSYWDCIEPNQIVPQKEFIQIQKAIKAAGHRLMRIKKEIWSGYETIKI